MLLLIVLDQSFSTFLLQKNLLQMFVLLKEPYEMIQVSILLSVINLWNSGIATTAHNCGCEFRAILVCFCRTIGSHVQNPEVLQNPGWKTLC